MAALQTLRNRPGLLMSVIGGALLLFIVTLTDLNSCSTPDKVGEVAGKEIKYQAFEQDVAQEENLMKMLSRSENMTAREQAQIAQDARLSVWNHFQTYNIVAKEAGKFGLTVGENEMKDALSSFNAQNVQRLLMGLQYGQIQVGQMSYSEKLMVLAATYLQVSDLQGYKQFIKDVDKTIAELQKQNNPNVEILANLKNACLYCEQHIAEDLLIQKYQTLMSLAFISNPISAKMTYDEQTATCNLDIVSAPYSLIQDKDVPVTDEEIKAEYEKVKPLFAINEPTLSLKLLHVQVTPSQEDYQTVYNEVKAIEDTLRGATTMAQVADIMRSTKSAANYQSAYYKKESFAQANMSAVTALIENQAVGAVKETTLESPDRQDGIQYMTTYKYVGTITSPDSVQYTSLILDSRAAVDSVIAAVKAGSTLSAEAKKHEAAVRAYQAKGDTTWVELPYYVPAEKMEGDTLGGEYTDICQIPAGEVTFFGQKNPQTGKTIYTVIHVLNTKAVSTKYNVAIVKYPYKFSKATFTAKRNALNDFLSKNRTLADMEANAAKAGFQVMTQNFSAANAAETGVRIGGQGIKDAFKWAFDEAKEGDMSKVYEVGTENDQFLVLGLEARNDKGYAAWDQPSVKAAVKARLVQQKKAEKLMAQYKDVKDLNAAEKKVQGASRQQAPTVNLSALVQNDPAFAGAIERTGKGKFTGPVAAANGVLLANVVDMTNSAPQKWAPAYGMLIQGYMNQQAVFDQNHGIMNVLKNNTKIEDLRYRF